VKLHRTDQLPDWERIEPQSRNLWQRIAARTNGIGTPGNAVSVAGGALVLKGLMDIAEGRTIVGTAEIGIGRICDIVDGFAADATGTKSPKGEALDASIDKVEIAAALATLAFCGLVPVPEAVLIGAQNAANIGISAAAKARERTIHPSKWGKLATLAQWGSLTLHPVSHLITNETASTLTEHLATGITGASLLMGAAATYGYLKDTFGKQ
jgi:phosphatidylglycerophosphate synthase